MAGPATSALLGFLALAGTVATQCPLQWSAGTGGGTVMVTSADGDVVAGGPNHVARFDGVAWQPLGQGVGGGEVNDLTELPNGDIVAVGSFTSAGGQPAPGIARWDGAGWSPLPAPLPGIALHAAAALPDGSVAVAGIVSPNPSSYTTHVVRWSGGGWQVIGTAQGTTGTTPFATPVGLGVLPAGELVALGDWHLMLPMGAVGPFNELVRWDGAAWHRLGDTPYPETLLVTRDGDVFVGSRHGVDRWHAGAYGPIGGGGGVRDLAELPDGSVVACGDLATTQFPPPIGLQRWRGGAWSGLGFGPAGSGIDAVALHGSGRLLVSGAFTAAGGVPAPGAAVLTTPCPATAQSVATACVGPAGPLRLLALGRPWVGATFHTAASGFAANAVAVALLGFGPLQLPLASLHPVGLPGCDLLASGEGSVLALPVAGVARRALPIPGDPILAGLVLRQQFVQAELGAAGALRSLSSSNALVLTLGAF